jgi:hypothetical protein
MLQSTWKTRLKSGKLRRSSALSMKLWVSFYHMFLLGQRAIVCMCFPGRTGFTCGRDSLHVHPLLMSVELLSQRILSFWYWTVQSSGIFGDGLLNFGVCRCSLWRCRRESSQPHIKLATSFTSTPLSCFLWLDFYLSPSKASYLLYFFFCFPRSYASHLRFA